MVVNKWGQILVASVFAKFVYNFKDKTLLTDPLPPPPYCFGKYDSVALFKYGS